MQRFDTVAFTATRTEEGFIRDSPIVGRAGILKYKNADGSDRFEYRPPEEAFRADSLASLEGKPITIGHKSMVNAGNASRLAPVGTVLSAGRQDGEDIRADVVIYNLDTAARELSCGYSLTLDETPGTTPDGQHYDAIQRNIVYNHVAIVPKGRAGVARLNMDGEQIVDDEQHVDNDDSQKEDNNMADKMTKIRLDGGLEYDAAPEVGVYVENLRKENEKLRADASEAESKAKKAYDELQAKYDASHADNEKLKEEAKKAEETAKANFDSAVKARVELLGVAEKHKIEKADSMTDKDIKLAVIKAVRGDKVNLDGKSDDYIEAAFDMAKDEVKQREDAMAQQRQATNQKPEGQQETRDTRADDDDPEAALEAMMKTEANYYMEDK